MTRQHRRHAGHRGLVHDRRRAGPARLAVHDVRVGVLPADRGFCRNPACAGEEFEATELSRRGTVWSYTDAQYQPPPPYIPASDPYVPFALAAVELPEGIVVLGQLADGYGVDGRPRRQRGRAGRRDALHRRRRGAHDLALAAGAASHRARRGGRPVSAGTRRRRPRRGHAPLGQVGPQLRRATACTPRGGAGGRRRRLGGRRPGRRWRDRAQRLRRLRRRRDLRPGAGLERRPRRHVVRRLRDRRPGARHRAGPDPRRALRGRAGGRRGHHAEGLPGAQRGGAVGRPRLAAVPAARHDQPRRTSRSTRAAGWTSTARRRRTSPR